MQVYSGYSYFVSFHTNGNEREGQIVSGAECYTKNPETGDGGWDIVWIRSTRKLIQKFPDFDCVITSGYPPHVDVDAVDFLDCEKY